MLNCKNMLKYLLHGFQIVSSPLKYAFLNINPRKLLTFTVTSHMLTLLKPFLSHSQQSELIHPACFIAFDVRRKLDLEFLLQLVEQLGSSSSALKVGFFEFSFILMVRNLLKKKIKIFQIILRCSKNNNMY